MVLKLVTGSLTRCFYCWLISFQFFFNRINSPVEVRKKVTSQCQQHWSAVHIRHSCGYGRILFLPSNMCFAINALIIEAEVIKRSFAEIYLNRCPPPSSYLHKYCFETVHRFTNILFELMVDFFFGLVSTEFILLCSWQNGVCNAGSVCSAVYVKCSSGYCRMLFLLSSPTYY